MSEMQTVKIYKTQHLASTDETITMPDEVHVLESGWAIAVHADSGNHYYESLLALEIDYGFDLDDETPTERKVDVTGYEGRSWDLYEDGFKYDTVTADQAERALAQAERNVDRDNYPEDAGTLFVVAEAVCEMTGERITRSITLEAVEPDCAESEHDWQRPLSLVGGLKENPGVHGKGGGVVIHEICRHCGMTKITDTWAQHPGNGSQGHTMVEYEEGRYSDEELQEAFPERGQVHWAVSLSTMEGFEPEQLPGFVSFDNSVVGERIALRFATKRSDVREYGILSCQGVKRGPIEDYLDECDAVVRYVDLETKDLEEEDPIPAVVSG